MKKKGRNDIPDFSKKRKDAGSPVLPEAEKSKPAPIPPVRVGKPPATSMKSGRRGS
jgi:hypothetical protein